MSLQDPVDVDIFVDRISGDLFENPAEVTFADIKVTGDIIERAGFVIVIRDIRGDFGDFLVCCGGRDRSCPGVQAVVIPEPLCKEQKPRKFGHRHHSVTGIFCVDLGSDPV